MQYRNCRKGIFRSRPNRFIAHVEVDGALEICHVKNTGRCKELLVDGAVVYLEEQSGSHRKTKFDGSGDGCVLLYFGSAQYSKPDCQHHFGFDQFCGGIPYFP